MSSGSASDIAVIYTYGIISDFIYVSSMRRGRPGRGDRRVSRTPAAMRDSGAISMEQGERTMSFGIRRFRSEASSSGRPLTVLDALFEGLVGMAAERSDAQRLDAGGQDRKVAGRDLYAGDLELDVAVTRNAPARMRNSRRDGAAETRPRGRERRKSRPSARSRLSAGASRSVRCAARHGFERRSLPGCLEG